MATGATAKPPQGLARWVPQRLSSRIVALFLGLLLVVQLASLAVVQWSIDRNAHAQLAQDLVVGERIWQRLLVQRAGKLALGASVLAADYGFRAAAASGDTETLSSALDNHGQRIGATVTVMLHPDLAPRARGASVDGATLEALHRLAPRLAQRGNVLALLDKQPFQLVMVPMKAPQLVGYILMGFPPDQALVDDIDAVAPYRPLKTTLAALTLLGLLLAGAASVFTARRVTTPLRSLVRATEHMGRGDYSHAMKHVERGDEIGELSRAFEQMRVSISSHELAIRQLAYWDRLTGLPNRAQFRDAVRKAISAATEAGVDGKVHPLAVVMLDLDRFKHVNDVLGYAFGDRLLKGMAERLLRLSVHEDDIVARLSGDEFALLLQGADQQAALVVAERVADVFQLPMTMDDHTVDLAAGFGVACWPAHAADADTLINRAEVAMYTAKRKSGAAQVYDVAIDASSTRSLSLLSELRRAVDNNELRLFLQPKIALVGVDAGSFTGAEALVRWCAGSTPNAAWCRRWTSSPSPSRPVSCAT